MRPPSLRRLQFGLDRFSGLYLWVLFIVLFGLWTPLFLTSGTVHAIASEQALVAILAVAVLIPLAAGAYDLSVGAMANLSTVLVAVLQTEHGWSIWPSIAAALACGALIGVINGFFVVKLRVSSFITTLGMASVIVAFVSIVTGGINPLPPTSHLWNELTQHNVLGFQSVLIFTVVVALIAWWALEHTPSGRYIYAVGANPEAARLTGVRVGKWTWLSLVVSGVLSALVGVLYASLDGPSLTYGQSLLLPAFACAFLGSTQLKPGVFNVWGTMIAVFALATGIKGIELVTGVQWLPEMFYGVALLVAVSFALWRQRAADNDAVTQTTSTPDDNPPSHLDSTSLDSQLTASARENKAQEPVSTEGRM